MVSVAEHCQKYTAHAHRSLEDPRNIFLRSLGVDIAQVCTRKFLMLRKVVVGAVVYTLNLVKSPRKFIFDVPGILGIKHQVLVLLKAQLFLVYAEREVPAPAILLYRLICLLVFVGAYKELRIRLFEFSGTEEEVAGRYLIAERLAYLGYAKRHLGLHGIDDIFVVQINSLARLAGQIYRLCAFGGKVSEI